jgi:tRNA pseudouridine(55) synthase
MIRPVYKPIGPTTHQLAVRAAAVFGETLTHTGSLDPMAHGVVTLLTEEDRFRKQELAPEEKQYRFQLVAGLQTDSRDLLGLLTEDRSDEFRVRYSDDVVLEEVRVALEAVLAEFHGETEQQLPQFSARRIEGESYFDKARRGEAFEPAVETVEIHALEIVGSTLITPAALATKAATYIPRIAGDFRQEEILEQWQTFGAATPSEQQYDHALPVFTLDAHVGKRTYIRALARDLARTTGVPFFVLDLERTADGEWGTGECVCLSCNGYSVSS